MPNPAGARQYGRFIELADVREWLQMSQPASPSAGDRRLERIVDMACTWVQCRIGRPCSDQRFYERHDGWSGEYIMLEESPLIAVVSCKEYMSSGGTVTLPESTPENPVTGIQVDYETGRIMRTFAGYSWPRTFFPGSRNIEVIYRAGFNPTPPDLWLATVEMASYWWRNTQQTSRTLRAGEEYDSADTSGLWAGVPHRITDLIDSYRKVGIA